jgi:hypothetical protein
VAETYNQTYYAKNRDRILARQKEQRQDPEFRARDNARRVERRKESPTVRLRGKMRTRRWQLANPDKVRASQAAFRAKSRNLALGLKTACIECGETHPACLDFHHRDPAAKEGTVARLVAKNVKLERVKAEIEKCDVLCANCHRKLHWAETHG